MLWCAAWLERLLGSSGAVTGLIVGGLIAIVVIAGLVLSLQRNKKKTAVAAGAESERSRPRVQHLLDGRDHHLPLRGLQGDEIGDLSEVE